MWRVGAGGALLALGYQPLGIAADSLGGGSRADHGAALARRAAQCHMGLRGRRVEPGPGDVRLCGLSALPAGAIGRRAAAGSANTAMAVAGTRRFDRGGCGYGGLCAAGSVLYQPSGVVLKPL